MTPSATAPPASGRADTARILVTDDQPEVLRAVARTLEGPYTCEFATDLGEVREKLATGSFELALCGVTTPGAEGLALVEEINRNHPGTVVVLVTTEDDPEVASQAFRFGVCGYLVEPFWPGQLLITVMSALRRRELEIAAQSRRDNLTEQRQKIIDMAPMAIYAKDATGNYTLANLRADSLAGLGEGELVGKTDAAIMSPGSLEATRAIEREMFDEGTSCEAEEALTIGGVERVFKTVKFPLFDEGGRVTSVCGISADITAEREALRLRDELAATQQWAIEKLWTSHRETVDCVARAVRLHDSSTGDHIDRMANVASLLGDRLQLGHGQVRLLRIAAPMHDVGKIAIADRILGKPGPLTADERAEMQRHTIIGHEILDGTDNELLDVAATIARTHHERFDGSGYPEGLAGYDIPIEGRITAVADVFDALLSDRCYRPAFPIGEAIELVTAGRGTQFDPAIVDALVDHLDEALAVRG